DRCAWAVATDDCVQVRTRRVSRCRLLRRAAVGSRGRLVDLLRCPKTARSRRGSPGPGRRRLGRLGAERWRGPTLIESPAVAYTQGSLARRYLSARPGATSLATALPRASVPCERPARNVASGGLRW